MDSLEFLISVKKEIRDLEQKKAKASIIERRKINVRLSKLRSWESFLGEICGARKKVRGMEYAVPVEIRGKL